MPAPRVYNRDDLRKLRPRFPAFVGIDSDGCVFPTMELKQKQCFHTLIVSHWHLEAIEKPVREVAEFVNLYSKWRGTNRFAALVVHFDFLRKRADVIASGVAIPPLDALRRFVESGSALGNPALELAAQKTGDPELAAVLAWSKDVNALIAKTVKRVPPYPSVLPSLERILATADAICVSQTPTEALVREWEEHDLMRFVRAIAGQELGSKAEHIALATRGRYKADKVLMIGDAPGDLKAAKANQAHFYPVNPGAEEASWERFHKEAYARFLDGTFAGEYEQACIAEFEKRLPDAPPWA